MKEILIIRNVDVPRLYDIVLADFEGESSRYLQQFVSFEDAVDIRREFGIMHNIAINEEA